SVLYYNIYNNFYNISNLSNTTIYHFLSFFFFNNTATTEIYTLSLHYALPILCPEKEKRARPGWARASCRRRWRCSIRRAASPARSEEHTSELQSRGHLVCRLLREKYKNIEITNYYIYIILLLFIVSFFLLIMV